jgi:hypothetical protein
LNRPPRAAVGQYLWESLRRREIEDAHWREILARFPAQAVEPPILTESDIGSPVAGLPPDPAALTERIPPVIEIRKLE